MELRASSWRLRLKSCETEHPSLITSVSVWATAPFEESRVHPVLSLLPKICQSSPLGLLFSLQVKYLGNVQLVHVM